MVAILASTVCGSGCDGWGGLRPVNPFTYHAGGPWVSDSERSRGEDRATAAIGAAQLIGALAK